VLAVSVVKVAVEGKDIVPEVARGVAPYRVRVVRAALGVVPFEEEVRALQPVVVGLSWLKRPGPGDVDGIEGVAVVAPQRRDAVGDAGEVRA
jgi:hypothetical protein